MIPKETIDKIFEEAKVEEVVGDFVSLKKRGSNYMGLCPFHNEKSPSFTVSPAKGIFKCFGCGAAGNSVNFIMQHEQISYPEALKQLAKKYNIEVIEEKVSEEQQEQQNEREGLFLVTNYATEHFSNNLLNTDEGKLIGLSYLKERGISDEMITHFALGFSLEQRDAFTQSALQKGYQAELLQNTGLSIYKEGMKPIDRFFGRVIFPIHNLSGRVLGFGARTLRADKKVAKYLNSPETEIYHKSKILYGIFQAKRTIIQKDNCYLVEGYTDVISFHQKGIENVVASSGTSLTEDQIKLIRRFTPNITVLFDGDSAGIKASFRGIDMLLKEDMNVKVLLFPDGEDPDSFARKHTTFELEHFLKDNAKDFISFKCQILLEEAGSDPIKKAELIKDVVNSISLISDNIIRSVYVKEASRLLDIEEQTLLNELNKIRRNKLNENPNVPSQESVNQQNYDLPSLAKLKADLEIPLEVKKEKKLSANEAEIIRILLLYGHLNLVFSTEDQKENQDENQENTHEISVAEYIVNDLQQEGLIFEHFVYQEIFLIFIDKLKAHEIPTEKYFIQNGSAEIVSLTIEMTNEKHFLSENWKKHLIFVALEEDQLKLAIVVACNRLKIEKVEQEIEAIHQQLKQNISEDQQDICLLRLAKLIEVRKKISNLLGRI